MIIYGFWFYEELRDRVGVSPGKHKGDYEDSYIILEDARMNLFDVKVSSLRMELFKQNPKCVTCHRVGQLWILEAHRRMETPHLNLYHVQEEETGDWKNLTKDGLVLMTKDHIIPRSAGGKTEIENLQTMCSICNGKKGNKPVSKLGHKEQQAIAERLGRKLPPSEMQCLGGMPHYK